jgi:predicted nucleic acid-binding protein
MDKIERSVSAIRGLRVYVDTNIFVYFLEADDRYINAIVPFFNAFEQGTALGFTGDAVVAETLYKPYRLDDILRVSEFKAFFSNEEFLTVLPHSTKAFELAAELSPKRGMKLIDALHFATAVLSGCQFILTNDAGFSSSKEIQVIHLQDLLI